MVYFICGHRGSGKSYAAHQLKDNLNCNLFDTGPIVRKAYKDYGNGLKFSEWLSKGESEVGKNFTNEIICRNIEIDPNETTIIIGNRALQGIEFIIQYFDIENYKICYLDGDYDLFRNNYNTREGLNDTKEEFNQIMKAEEMMGITDIEKFVYENPDKSIYYFKNQNDTVFLDLIMEDIKSKKKVLKK